MTWFEKLHSLFLKKLVPKALSVSQKERMKSCEEKALRKQEEAVEEDGRGKKGEEGKREEEKEEDKFLFT